MEQVIIDRAVNIATKAALSGQPVERIIWVAPASAMQDSIGSFCVVLYPPLSIDEIAPWDR